MRRVGNIHQHAPRVAGIDHGPAEEIRRGAGHRQQRGRDQAAGRGFRDRDGLAAARSAARRFSRRWQPDSFMRCLSSSVIFLALRFLSLHTISRLRQLRAVAETA